MRHLNAFDRLRPDLLALQANIERAGSTMACAYSSSDEFEAAVRRATIHARTQPRRFRRYVIYAGTVACLLAGYLAVW
jgi:hypothetical protein